MIFRAIGKAHIANLKYHAIITLHFSMAMFQRDCAAPLRIMIAEMLIHDYSATPRRH